MRSLAPLLLLFITLVACGGNVTPPGITPDPEPSPTATATEATPAPTPTPTPVTFVITGNVYEVDAETGELTPTDTAGIPEQAVGHPSGRFTWRGGNHTSNISYWHTYSISGDGRAADTGLERSFAAEAVFSPVASERFLHFICTDTASVETYLCSSRIDARSGALEDPVRFGKSEQMFDPRTSGFDALAVSPDGQTLYAAEYTKDQGSLLVAYSVGSTGAGIPVRSVPFTGVGRAIAVRPDGRFLYVLSQGPQSGHLTILSLNQDGYPNPVTSRRIQWTGRELAIEPLGRFLYVSAYEGIEPYAIDDRTGDLAPLRSYPMQKTGPSRMAFEPGGRFAYLSRGQDDGIWGYVIDPDTGSLQDLGKLGHGRFPLVVSRPRDEGE